METMSAAIFKEDGKISVEDRPVPKILLPTDAIIKVQFAGVCGSFIPGHDFVGTIHAVGEDVKGFKSGEDAVVSAFSLTYILLPCYICLGFIHIPVW